MEEEYKNDLGVDPVSFSSTIFSAMLIVSQLISCAVSVFVVIVLLLFIVVELIVVVSKVAVEKVSNVIDGAVMLPCLTIKLPDISTKSLKYDFVYLFADASLSQDIYNML